VIVATKLIETESLLQRRKEVRVALGVESAGNPISPWPDHSVSLSVSFLEMGIYLVNYEEGVKEREY